MPKPSAALFVVGVLAQALFAALKAKQRADFTAALVSICDTQEAGLSQAPSKPQRGLRNGADKEMSQAVAWWRALLAQLSG